MYNYAIYSGVALGWNGGEMEELLHQPASHLAMYCECACGIECIA